MKLSKRGAAAAAFAIGAVMFITTAFADVALGSGYDKFKGAIKLTSSQMESKLDNYTFETLFTLKDNEKTLIENSTFMKVDNRKNASEEISVEQYMNVRSNSSYSYSDTECSIWKRGGENGVEDSDKYYLTEFTGKSRQNEIRPRFSDPFKEKGATEVEKIFDAAIGNLKDYVQAEETPEGGKKYSGSLSEAQVPALVNAVSSFFFKNSVMDRRTYNGEKVEFPQIESDISIEKVSGSAVQSKDGLLENVSGEILLTGKDKDGVEHQLVFNIAVKLYDVGKTNVSKPDLTDKKVEKSYGYMGFDSKYIGKYKNDIVMEDTGSFVKIGERNVEILSVSDTAVTGRYYETIKPGYEKYIGEVSDFTFEMKQDDDRNLFTYTDASGESKKGQLHMGGNGKLYIQLEVEIVDEHSTRSSENNRYFDSQLSKVFEN